MAASLGALRRAFEPYAVECSTANIVEMAAISQAISLKRIADGMASLGAIQYEINKAGNAVNNHHPVLSDIAAQLQAIARRGPLNPLGL